MNIMHKSKQYNLQSYKSTTKNIYQSIRPILLRVMQYDSIPIQTSTQNENVEYVKEYQNKSFTLPINEAPNIDILDEKTIRDTERRNEMEYYSNLSSVVLQFSLGIAVLIMIITMIINVFRNASGGGISRGITNFVSGKGYEKNGNDIGVKFSDIAGLETAKSELQEIVDFLKNPEKYSKIGAKVPKGCLLSGGPGLGKTLLAKAVAGEAAVPFFSCSAAEFIEMFVGVGASRIRDIFQKAKAKAPCIIFIDEIDAIGRTRGGNSGFGANDEREQTINQLLTEMDGFEPRAGIIIIAATNRPDILDPALIRPGRFDRQINLELPGVKAREEILQVHSMGKPFEEDVSFASIAKITGGFSGAQLANLLNESAIFAARRNVDKISMYDIEHALDRILLGIENKNQVISYEKKELVAYHEAGHALAAMKVGEYDEIKKVTIISRGQTGGVTMFEQDSDRIESGLYTREYLENQLVVALGGRAAEEVIYGKTKVTTGASSDLEKVQQIARAMVMRFGFNETLGYVSWRDGSKLEMNYSEKTLREIDSEVKSLAENAYKRAYSIIYENKQILEKIKEALIEKETINGDDIMRLCSCNNNV